MPVFKILKMKPAYLLISLAALFTACSGGKTSVSGKIENAKNETLFFEHLTATKAVKLDSMKLDKSGHFKFSATIPGYGFYRVRLTDNNFITLLLDSASCVEISANALNLQEGYTITGSPESQKIQDLYKDVNKYFSQRDSISRLYNALMQEGKMDSITAATLTAQFLQINSEQRNYVLNFIKENSNTLLPLLAIQYLSQQEDSQEIIRIAESLAAVFPDNEYVKNLNSRVNELKRVAIGSPAPEIIVNDPDGKQIKLSDLRGKVVLIDFWASWCKPCRMENPNVVKIYKKYKDKGFEIFGVSLDKGKEEWIQAIKDDKLTWKHGSELAFWNSSFVKTYNIDGIPKTFLLDKNGNIIAKDLRGEQLEKKLAEIFN